MQGHNAHSEWTSGFSWYELAGGILTSNQDDYQALTEKDIEQEFRLLHLD